MTCPTCNADVIAVATYNSRRTVHLDPAPAADGTVELLPARGAQGPYAVTWGTSHRWPPGISRWRFHRCTEAGAA